MTYCIGQQHPITIYRTVFCACVVLVLSVIRCSCYYFLDIILFYHDSLNYHWDVMAIHYFLNYSLGFLSLSNSGSANAQLPGCFRQLDILLKYLIEYVPSDSFMSCLHSLLGYSTGEFQPLHLISLRLLCRGLTSCPLYVGTLFGNLV